MTGELVATIAAGLVMAVFVAVVRWLRRALQRDHEAAVLRVVEPRLAEIRGELRPNGGTSAYDHMERRLNDIEGRVADLATLLAKHIDQHRRGP